MNVIAHSMGGLDARWAIARLGLRDRVASLVTIGAPHRGTPLADVGSKLSRLGFDIEAFHDLSTKQMKRFNAEVPDSRGIDYMSIVGSVRDRSGLNPLLWPTHAWLSAKAGANDGIVPARSQRWGDVLRKIEERALRGLTATGICH